MRYTVHPLSGLWTVNPLLVEELRASYLKLPVVGSDLDSSSILA